MAIEARADPATPQEKEHPFAHLRAAPEEIERLRALAPPQRTLEEWLQSPLEPSEEELADLEWFLEERERMRQHGLKRLEERLAELGE